MKKSLKIQIMKKFNKGIVLEKLKKKSHMPNKFSKDPKLYEIIKKIHIRK